MKEVVKLHGGVLLSMLCKMGEVADALCVAFQTKCSPFELRFLAECHEDGEKKMPKMPHNLELPDLRRSIVEFCSLLD